MEQPEINNTQRSQNTFFSNRGWVLLSTILLFSGLVWIYLSRVDQNNIGVENESAPFVGFKAPKFNLPSETGETVSSLDFLGAPLVINLWTSWCPPCRAEMPAMERVYQEYQDKGLEFIAVNITNQDSKQKAIQFKQDVAISFPILFDENGEISELYQLQALPTTFFIDENGIIKEVVIGGPMSETLLRTRVEDIFDQMGDH